MGMDGAFRKNYETDGAHVYIRMPCFAQVLNFAADFTKRPLRCHFTKTLNVSWCSAVPGFP